MAKENYITLTTICTAYNVEMTFINDLKENDLLKISYVEDAPCIHQDLLTQLEKILRLHQDLKINVAGIDAVFNLLHQVDDLQLQIGNLQNRLSAYED